MATHSSILAWEIPFMEEPGGLESMGSKRVRQDLATNNNTELWVPRTHYTNRFFVIYFTDLKNHHCLIVWCYIFLLLDLEIIWSFQIFYLHFIMASQTLAMT